MRILAPLLVFLHERLGSNYVCSFPPSVESIFQHRTTVLWIRSHPSCERFFPCSSGRRLLVSVFRPESIRFEKEYAELHECDQFFFPYALQAGGVGSRLWFLRVEGQLRFFSRPSGALRILFFPCFFFHLQFVVKEAAPPAVDFSFYIMHLARVFCPCPRTRGPKPLCAMLGTESVL